MYGNLWEYEHISNAYDRILDTKVGYGNYQRILLFFLGLTYATNQSSILAIFISIPSIQKEWNLNILELAIIASSIFLGISFGQIIGDILSKYFGRRITLLISSTLHAAFGLLISFDSSWTWLSFMTFISGVSFGLTFVIPTFLGEVMPTGRRSRANIIIRSYLVYGALHAIILSKWLFDDLAYSETWRTLICLTTVPSLPVIFVLLKYIQESPKFLILKGEFIQGLNSLAAMGKYNHGDKFAGVGSADNFDLYMWQRKMYGEPDRTKWSDIFQKENRKRSYLLLAIWTGLNFIYYGLAFILPLILSKQEAFGQDHGLNILLFLVFGDIPAIFLIYLLLDKKKLSKKSTMMLCSFCMMLNFTFIVLHQEEYLFWALSLTRTATVVSYLLLQPIIVESFRRSLRRVAFQTITLFSRLSGALIPFFYVGLFHFGDFIPFIGSLAISFIIFCSVYTVSKERVQDEESKGLELDELIGDKEFLDIPYNKLCERRHSSAITG
jgi:Sugar phosphate permease